MPRLALLPVLLALALGAAACGDDEEGSAPPASSGTTPQATEEAPAEEAAGGAVAISLKDNLFAPAQASAKVGDAVTWTNDGQVAHNVVAQEGEDFKSDTLEPGDTFEYKLDKAGTISYVCTFHPGMEGTLTVE